MFYWFRRLMLNRVYAKVIKKPKPGIAKKAKTLRSISVILDHRMKIDISHFKQMGASFDISAKNVRVLTYYPSSKDIPEEAVNSSYTSTDISSFGVMRPLLYDFCNFKSDVLINFYDQNDISLKYVSAMTHYRYSVGLKNVDLELNDLVIDVDPKNITLFIQESIKYLKIFFAQNK